MPVYNESMDYSVLGRTGLSVSRLGFGATGIGDMYSKTQQDDATKAVEIALEAGINYFDSAPSYGPEGLAEERLGIALGTHRKDIILTTKCGRYDHGKVDAADFEFDYSAKRARLEIENSLRRLKTDYIDIYQIHEIRMAPNLTMLIEETLPEMEKMRQEGKIRYIGITDTYLDMLKYVAERSPSVDMLLTFGRYNLVDTSLSGYFDDLKKSRNVGVVNSSVMYIGMLTMDMHTLAHHRAEDKHVELKKAVRKCIALCQEKGYDLGALAMQFGSHCDAADSTLVAMGRPSRINQNLKLYREPVDMEFCKQLHEILEGQTMFPPIPMKI